MSQLTAVRNASRTHSTAQWWTLSVYSGGFDVADGIIGELVTPLAAQAQTLGAQRWFYTRCSEPANAHVRLKVLGSPETLERLQCLLGALREQASGVIGHLEAAKSSTYPPGNLPRVRRNSAGSRETSANWSGCRVHSAQVALTGHVSHSPWRGWLIRTKAANGTIPPGHWVGYRYPRMLRRGKERSCLIR